MCYSFVRDYEDGELYNLRTIMIVIKLYMWGTNYNFNFKDLFNIFLISTTIIYDSEVSWEISLID